ncbi:Uncharacterised protein [Vibrio cholerae]|uniref:Uncharacterized protein n=1 Tax=Vibrio cholerae TaxID=666 RepID=A0A655ZMK5_VIBCL|nr:Uncharacterised protein [Vibrio cholerae]CSC74441.1 Uncharacterised protein [Vibrio cholerae]CSC88356.1 Uncharacterised protein [Vibrio cholerae]
MARDSFLDCLTVGSIRLVLARLGWPSKSSPTQQQEAAHICCTSVAIGSSQTPRLNNRFNGGKVSTL